MRLFPALVVLLHLANYPAPIDAGGGGKGKHDVLKIHVPEIIKHQFHTHYVFIHKHPPKKPKKTHHHHKHVHIPQTHHHKHWYGHKHKSVHKHKSSHGHGHGHGHPVVKTVIKHHKPPPPMKHKPHHPKPHHPPKMHKHPKAKHPKKPHDYYPFNHDQIKNQGYEVNEDIPNNDYAIPEEYMEEGDYGYDDEDPYSTKPYFNYPPIMGQYENPAITSYDISPYYQVDELKSHENIGDATGLMMNYEGEALNAEYKPNYENEFSSQGFGESIPGYGQHHKQFLNEINHSVHSDYNDGGDAKYVMGSDGGIQGYTHEYEGHYSSHT